MGCVRVVQSGILRLLAGCTTTDFTLFKGVSIIGRQAVRQGWIETWLTQITS